MNIGKETEEWWVEPLQEPREIPEPERAPEPEKVPA